MEANKKRTDLSARLRGFIVLFRRVVVSTCASSAQSRSVLTAVRVIVESSMRDIRTDDYQTVIDKMVRDGKSRSLCEKVRQLCSQMGKYAVREDIADRNYADFIHLPKNEKKEKEIFSADEIRRLWEVQNNPAAKIVLILIYTGFRINELFDMKKADVNLADGYIIGGEKTEAGKNRMVPIHPCIRPLIEWWAVEKESEYLISNTAGGRKDAKNFRERDYYPLLDQLREAIEKISLDY